MFSKKLPVVLLVLFTLATGQLFAQKKNGQVIEKSSSNVGNYTRTANYKNDVLDGAYAETFDKDSRLKVSGQYSNGKKTGRWDYGKPDGTKSLTEIYDDAGNVTKKITYYNNGNPDVEREYKDGKYHGVTKKYAQDGTLKSEENFANGKEHGPFMQRVTVSTNGYVVHSNFENGLKDGDYLEEYLNGNLKVKGQYKQDKKDGTWTYGEPDGKKTKEETYVDGKLTETKKL